MRMLVKFIAVENKNLIDDNESYVYGIYKSIHEARLIKSLNLSPDEVTFGVGAIRPLDEEDNGFLLQFNSEANGKADIWSVYFQYGTYNNIKQLEIAIFSETYLPDVENDYLEKLKLVIKKSIRGDWDKIIWLVDKDSECLSIKLYPQIYKIENLMRELINEVMNKQYGTTWWDTFATANIKKKHSDRLKEFKAKIQSFNDVDERLMCIDISDLSELMELRRYYWKPVFDGKISAMLNGVQEYKDGTIHELLLKQREIEIDLWAEQFSKYLPDDFNDRYRIFARDRNHIMHNKLIDRPAYVKIKGYAEQIQQDLLNALNKIHKMILSEEEKFEIEKQRQIEQQMLEEMERECRENDANVSIRNREEIEELLYNSLDSLIRDLEEKLRFRNDISVLAEKDFHGNSTSDIITIKSNIDGSEITLKFDIQIDDSEGAESVLRIYSESEFSTKIIYTNGAVEYDYDSGLYMPVTQDDIESAEKSVDDIIEMLDDEMQNYKENANEDDIASLVVCSECGDNVICINEELLPLGTCMSCGHINDIYVCEKCNEWFNNDVEGTSEDDGYILCQNCLDALVDW